MPKKAKTPKQKKKKVNKMMTVRGAAKKVKGRKSQIDKQLARAMGRKK